MYKRYLYLFFFLSFIFSYQSSARSYHNVDAQPITICSSAPITIQGDIETPAPNSYLWQVLQGGSWVNAPGIINLADYTASKLVNNTTANMVFSIRRQIVTAGVTDYDSFYDVTVLPSAPVTGNQITAPAISSFCITGSATAITGNIATGGNGTVVYQWQQSIDNVNFANIAGATASSYTPPTLNVTTYYRRLASAGSCVAASTSNVVSIVIIQTAGGNTITTPAISNFCASSNPSVIAGSTATGGDGTYTYQWQSSSTNSNFTDIPGANTKDYNPSVITTTTYFRRYVLSGACSTPVYSNIVLISILPALGNNTITAPTVASFCVGGDATTINGTTPTGGDGTYTYQWQQSTDNSIFTDIPGATDINYDPSFISVSTYYRRNIISGQCTTPVSSNAILINILPVPAVPVPTQASVSICSGTAATLSISNPQAGLVYNWYDSATKTTLLFTGTTYTTALLTANTTFYIESSNGICSSLSLAPVQAVIIVPVPITNNSISLPAINNFCTPSDPDVITGSSPGGGTGTYLYQWQSSTDNVTFTDIPGATDINYDPAFISTTTYYRRSVISGPCTTPVFGNTVAIAILPAITNNTITAPSVTSFCLGGDASAILGNTPTGGNGNYIYQWQQSTDNSTFTDIAGATSSDFDPSFISVTTYYRRMVIAGQCTTPVLSNVISINIVPVPDTPVPVQAVVNICPGSSASLAVGSPQAGFTYNWYDSAAKTTLLYTGITYLTPPQTAAATYYIESSNGSCTSSALGVVQVALTAPPDAPLLVNSTINICVNSATTITVLNPQGGFTYRWYASADGTNVIFSGSTFTSPLLSANTNYYVEAVNQSGCTSTSKSIVNIMVSPLPVVTTQNATNCAGSPVTLSATANITNATFNWYNSATGGTPVYTGSAFTIPAVTGNISYYVEAVNPETGCVSATRQIATATIAQPLPAPVVTFTGTTYNSVSFSWNAVPNATAYQVSTDNGATYHDPSSGSNGLTDVEGNLKQNQAVTILVRAVGAVVCQLSPNSAPVTGVAQGQGDEIYVANAFTPNGDGVNDIAYVHSEGIKSFDFYVCDQWGEMIFTTSSQTTGWDGTYKGKREPVGVYIYYVKATMNNGHQLTKKGTITLLR